MTVVCVWRDNTFTPPRLVAVADRRLSSKAKWRKRVVHTDEAIKLFAVPVKCFELSQLATQKALVEPYDSNVIGLGYSGTALESLIVSTLIIRALGHLSAHRELQKPEPLGLANLGHQILNRFMSSHAMKGAVLVRILMFGWDGERPWVAKLGWGDPNSKAPSTLAPLEFNFVDSDAIFWIGGHKDLGRTASAQRKAATRAHKGGASSVSEADVKKALHALELSKAVEDALWEILGTPGVGTVGGVFDRLELIRRPDDVIASFSTDTYETVFDGLPSVSSVAPVSHVPIKQPHGS